MSASRARSARLIKDVFRRMSERGVAILMSTHTLEVAETLCDRVAIIAKGTIRACGTMPELRAAAASTGDSEGLEQIFLRLTGENAARELVEVLDA